MTHIDTLQKTSVSRANEWHNGNMHEWSVSDWMVALVGEVGEAANIVKKLNRSRDGARGNKETDGELRNQLQDELADILLYLVLVAESAKCDLQEVTISKFNGVSQKHGFTHRIKRENDTLIPASKIDAMGYDGALATGDALVRFIESMNFAGNSRMQNSAVTNFFCEIKRERPGS